MIFAEYQKSRLYGTRGVERVTSTNAEGDLAKVESGRLFNESFFKRDCSHIDCSSLRTGLASGLKETLFSIS